MPSREAEPALILHRQIFCSAITAERGVGVVEERSYGVLSDPRGSILRRSNTRTLR
jgi:hypothetical protein